MIAILIKAAAVLIAIGLSALATGVAFTFGLQQSTAELFGIPLWATAAALAAAALPTLPFLSRNAWVARRWGALVAAGVIASLFAGFTLAGSFGFGATSRSSAAAASQSKILDRSSAERDISRLQDALDRLPDHGSVESITMRIKALQNKPKTNANAIVEATRELGSAQREIEIRGQLDAARKSLPPPPKTLSADPQAEGLASLASLLVGDVTADEVRTGVSGWLALLLDLGAGLLLFVASSPIAQAAPSGGGGRKRWSANEWFSDQLKQIKKQIAETPKTQIAVALETTDAEHSTLTDADPVFAGGAELPASVVASVSADVVSIVERDPRISVETVRKFVTERCCIGAAHSVATADLAREYGAMYGIDPVSTVLLGRALAEAGYKRTEIRADGRIRRGWRGLSIKQGDEAVAG